MSTAKIDIIQIIFRRKKETIFFFIIFYVVGIIGLRLPYSFPLFLKLIPFALVLSFTGLIPFHLDKTNKKSLLAFIVIFFLAVFVEAIGVKTGLIFGFYEYGSSLGFKILSTPIIIGLNWLFLVYTTSSVLEKVKIHNVLKIILASAFMVAYDIVLEQVAPDMDMWNWQNEIIPLQNYLAWFAISVVFHSLLKALKINTENALAGFILICQFLFFLCLNFILN